MKRDTAKTIVGLVIIAGIVVATFMYGNSQRQAQLKHDQEVKDQQVAKATSSPAAEPTASPQQVAKAASTSKQTTNTAPAETPSANSIQGGAASPAPTTSAGAVASATTTPLPQTGPSSTLSGAAGVAVLVVSVAVWRRSKRSVLAAARAQR